MSGSVGGMVLIKKGAARLLDHAFDLVPALVLLAVCAGQARHLVIAI
jgi:hypothetical protein